MKIVIKDVVHDTTKIPVIIKMNKLDIKNIASMDDNEAVVFGSFPDSMTDEEREALERKMEYIKHNL